MRSAIECQVLDIIGCSNLFSVLGNTGFDCVYLLLQSAVFTPSAYPGDDRIPSVHLRQVTVEKCSATRNRRSQVIEAITEMIGPELRLGIDLGGTKIEAAAIDRDGAVLSRERVATPRGDYDATIAAIVALVARIEGQSGRTARIGVAIPGTLSPATGLVKNANSTWLIGRPFDRDLATSLGRPVRMANDANCFALSEAVDGAGRGAHVVFGVILGTGCGGGVVIDGRVLTGAHAIAGEWGHNPLPWVRDDERPGRTCYCGQSGCIETWLSGPGFAADFENHAGQRADPAEIAARAEAGDPKARAARERYRDRLARALASVINVLDPDVIVLGGGMSNIEALYPGLSTLIGRHVFSDRFGDQSGTPVRRAVHGDSSGVRGAAWLWRVDERG